MELRLFSCLSFLWPEKDASKCDACAHCGSGAAPLDSCPWENQLAPLLHRINDPAELRRVLSHCLGDVDGAAITGQIPLSRLLLPFKLHSDGSGGGDREEESEEEEDVERLVLAIDDVVAAVTKADSQGCVRSLVSAFEFFDRDGDGVISAADLLPALRDVLVAGGEEEDGQQGERGAPSAAACEEMVAAFDRERVGGVCFADFIRMMTGPDGDLQYCRRPSCRRPVPDSVLKPAHP